MCPPADYILAYGTFKIKTEYKYIQLLKIFQFFMRTVKSNTEHNDVNRSLMNETRTWQQEVL
jgi:hypothetical protein